MNMMAQRLYELLPAIYRIRDAEKAEVLRAFCLVVAEPLATHAESHEQQYDDVFIETCAEKMIPYIGDLIGYRALHNVVPNLGNQRAEVAHTIAYRRRKGTAAMLEQLARDVTGWSAHAVEFFELLCWTQNLNHVRPDSQAFVDLRNSEAIERMGGPFETASHLADMRRIATNQGKYNVPNIGIFVWRLKPYSLTETPATPLDDQRFFFDPLGDDKQLFTSPLPEDEITHLAEPVNVWEPISRLNLVNTNHLEQYYGAGKSVFIEDIAADRIKVCNLSDADSGKWAHKPKPGDIAIDPVLGRIASSDNRFSTESPPVVTFHYGFSADVGGGEYDRLKTLDSKLSPVLQVIDSTTTLQSALDTIQTGGVVEIVNSHRYREKVSISAKGKAAEFRAANHHRPAIILNGPLEITGNEDSEVTLNGLVFKGDQLIVPARSDNKMRRLMLRHCTFLNDGKQTLVISSPDLIVDIDHCIVGSIATVAGVEMSIRDSIVDAGEETKVAISALDQQSAAGPLVIENTTIIGKINTIEMRLVSNSIIVAALGPGDNWAAGVGTAVRSEKKQSGCARFSYIPPGSQTPRRYRCQPDLEIVAQISRAEKRASGKIPTAEREAIRNNVESWLVPSFESLRYGKASYAQLRLSCPYQIRQGAEDESEMGVFRQLRQAQRETNLRVRLDEYLRFGLGAGIIYVT